MTHSTTAIFRPKAATQSQGNRMNRQKPEDVLGRARRGRSLGLPRWLSVPGLHATRGETPRVGRTWNGQTRTILGTRRAALRSARRVGLAPTEGMPYIAAMSWIDQHPDMAGAFGAIAE